MKGIMRRFLFALALLALAGGLTACGSVRSTVDPVAAAATKSQKAGGFSATMSMTISADGREFTMTGYGLFGKGEGQMELDMSDLFSQLGAELGSNSKIKAIYVTEDGNPVMYMNLGFMSAFIPGGKTWVRVDLAKAGKAAGLDFNQLLGGANQSPADSLALLRSSGDFTEVGKETVEGVETTHYHGTIDLQKAVAAKGASAEVLQRLLELGAPAEYPADVWIDEDDFVRQFKSSYDMTAGGKSVSMSMTMGMSDYGMPVEVSAPPGDQVFDLTDLAAKGLQSQLNQGSTS
jgi:hypothetical protein